VREDIIPSIESIVHSLLNFKQICKATIGRIVEQKSISLGMLKIQFLKTTKQISDQILLIDTLSLHLERAMKSLSIAKGGQLRASMERNKQYMLLGILQNKEASLMHQKIVLAQIFKQYWYKKQQSLSHLSQLLASYGYKETLKRGFSLARTHNNSTLIPRKNMVEVGDELTLEFYDGSVTVSVRST